jgi:hypothetical protein
MKRLLLLVVAVAGAISIVLPSTAGAANWRGVVIAKDSTRKALVTVSRNGAVRTVRARGSFRRVGLGRLVAVQAAKLPDGTFSAGAVKAGGKARRAHFRAVVVVRQGARLVVSAGGSVFALRVRSKTGASTGEGGLEPGDEVDCNVVVKGGSLETGEQGLKEVGHSDQLVLEGIYLATADDGTIELAVVHRGRVFVRVPDGLELPAFAAGDEIALVVAVEADGSFTLIKAENENDAGEDSGGDDPVDIDAPKAQFSVVGVLAAVSAESVAVKVEQHPEPVSCAVPHGYDVSAFKVGQLVLMYCKYADGNPVLIALKAKNPEPSGDYLAANGTLASFDSSTIQVQVEGHSELVSCAVPDGVDLLGFAVGEYVAMYCKNVDGIWTLRALKSSHALVTPDGAWFYLGGVITDLSSDSISIHAEHHPSPVTCTVADGADLSGFQIGDHIVMKCNYVDGGFELQGLKSETAEYLAGD